MTGPSTAPEAAGQEGRAEISTRPHTHYSYDWEPCTSGCPAHPSAPTELPRMRVKRGRVMHRVRVSGRTDYEPLCRNVYAAHGNDWTTDRAWYPDCEHCPQESR